MGVEVIWDNDDKTIIRFIYMGKFTDDDVAKAMEKSNRMMDAVDHPVIKIIDHRDTDYLAQNMGVQMRKTIHGL